MLLPVLLLGAQMLASRAILVADPVPNLDIGPSCRAAAAAAAAAVTNTRDTASCEQDENNARAKLEQELSQFTAAEQERCVQLTRTGGNPSYVEVLTCLEISKGAKDVPAGDRLK